MYFDTHAHYDDEQFDSDRLELLAEMPGNGIDLILNPGCEGSSSQTAIALAERFPHVYAAVGWHPEHALSFDAESEEQIRKMAVHPKVKAIGEIGLDYYYSDGAPRQVQKDVFCRQLALARELSLPVIVHDREAHADCLDAVKAFPGVQGVFHCYSGSPEMARQLLDLGWMLSFTGAVTFKNARRAPEVISACPLDRIMLETDSPYLSPEPRRGRRNDSRMLPYIARRIAEIKGLDTETVARRTRENGLRFFGIEVA